MAQHTGTVAPFFRTSGSPLTGTVAPPHRYMHFTKGGTVFTKCCYKLFIYLFSCMEKTDMKENRKCKLEDAKIMILDDNQANLKLLERIPQKEQHTIH